MLGHGMTDWDKMSYVGCPEEVFGKCPINEQECTLGDVESYCPKKMTLKEALQIAESYLEGLANEGTMQTSLYMARHRIRQRLKMED